MTMKSTLIVPMTLLAALAAGVLVHDRVKTKSFVQDAAPTRTGSIATARPAAPAPVSPPPDSAPAPATPEPEPPRRMTASQEASLDAWMMKTYLSCWKPAAQPADADPYVARVRLKFKPDGSLLKPPKLVNPPSDPAQKPQAKSVLQAVKRATLYRCRLNTAPFMGNGRPRPSTSIRGLPPADPGHEPTMSAS